MNYSFKYPFNYPFKYPLTKTWKSSDCKNNNSREENFNGIKIIGTPKYVNKEFESLNILFCDYTLNPMGAEKVVNEMTVSMGRIEISREFRHHYLVMQAGSNQDFSIKGWAELIPVGFLLYLDVQIDYGLESQKNRHEGFVMVFERKLDELDL